MVPNLADRKQQQTCVKYYLMDDNLNIRLSPCDAIISQKVIVMPLWHLVTNGHHMLELGMPLSDKSSIVFLEHMVSYLEAVSDKISMFQ